MDEPEVAELLREEEQPDASALLARAFRDNPGMVAVLNSEEPSRRAALLGRLMPVFVGAYAKHGSAWVVRDGERLAGVALLLPPDGYPPSFALQAQLTGGVIRRMPPLSALRLGVADALLKRRHLRGRHHYLFMLGVEPELQGRGHGGRLLRTLSAQADRDGLPCYLETDRESSMRLYTSHGFAVMRQETLSYARNLQLWLMQRSYMSRTDE
jgi:ribosomal protein S18 acetylase RimI-like enzyme